MEIYHCYKKCAHISCFMTFHIKRITKQSVSSIVLFIDIFLYLFIFYYYYFNYNLFLVSSLLNTEVRLKISNVTLYKLYRILKSN